MLHRIHNSTPLEVNFWIKLHQAVASKDPEVKSLLEQGFTFHSNYKSSSPLLKKDRVRLETELGSENIRVTSNAYDSNSRKTAGVVAIWVRRQN